MQKDKELPIAFDRGSTDPKFFYEFSPIMTPQAPKPPSVKKVIYIHSGTLKIAPQEGKKIQTRNFADKKKNV